MRKAGGRGKEPEERRRFITENIVGRPLTKRQFVNRGLVFLFLAVLFGFVAAVTFVVSVPFAEDVLEPETEEESATVLIPKDETAEVIQEETTLQETSETETEPLEKVVEEAVANYRYTVDDVGALAACLRRIVQEASGSVVTVQSVRQGVDWLDNPVEMTGLYAGAIIAGTDTELLVMTPLAAVDQADRIKVTFAGGEEADGRMKQQDTISKVAVISVSKEGLGEVTLAGVRPMLLGNSYLVKEGDLLIAVGGTAGAVHSSDYGFVSYIQTNMQMVDRKARVLYSRIASDAGRGTFFINTSGEMVGWAMELEDEEEPGTGLTQIVGISDYKGILEDLSNGQGAPCLGIQGHIVSDAMREQGMPSGLYVLDVVNDRPAYNAGIQDGDIITSINGHETISSNEFQNVMDGLECGQTVHVTVARTGREEIYAELDFQVTVGAR